jgi:uncharacterized ferredoxin-like protein
VGKAPLANDLSFEVTVNPIQMVADLMSLAARTAPKTKGEDFIVVKVLGAEEARKLGEDMIAYGKRAGETDFDRDGTNVKASEAVFLVGIKDAKVPDLNCGACGQEKCLVPNTFQGGFKGPNCAFRIVDLGIALGSAVKMAALLNVDNRIMFRVGLVACQMNWIDADLALGVPLSASGKSIFFDRASVASARAAS